MPKVPKFIKVGAIIFIFGVIIEAWVVNSLSSFGDKLSELEGIKLRLELENQVLKNSIAREKSLKLIEVRAKSVGFEAVKNLEYIR